MSTNIISATVPGLRGPIGSLDTAAAQAAIQPAVDSTTANAASAEAASVQAQAYSSAAAACGITLLTNVAGSGNAITSDLPVGGYVDGRLYRFQSPITNTGPFTINGMPVLDASGNPIAQANWYVAGGDAFGRFSAAGGVFYDVLSAAVLQTELSSLKRKFHAIYEVLNNLLSAVPAQAATSLRTTSDLATALASTAMTPFVASSGSAGAKEVLVDTSTHFQSWIGAGAALTDSAAYVLMTSMTQQQRTAFLTQMFSTTDGLGLNFLRLTMGDSDYTIRNRNGGGTAANTFSIYDNATSDDNLASFSAANDQTYIVPALKEILAINPNVKLIAAPWSPPVYFKTTKSLVTSGNNTYYGNTPANNAEYAQYFVKFQQFMYAQIGKYTEYTTVQNEPNFNPSTYPGCRFNGADIAALGVAIDSAFNAVGIPTQILSGDASWGDTTIASGNSLSLYPFQNGQAAAFAGAAYHAYDGQASQMAEMAAYPGKLVFMTEHCGNSPSSVTASNWLAFMGDDMIASPYYGAQVICFWNLALDPSGQPGTADNLQPVATIAADGTVTLSPQYYALAHLMSYVQPGARRVSATTFGTLGRGGTDVQTVAFLNPDASVALVLFNSGNASATVSIKDQQGGNKSTSLTLAAQEVRSVKWRNAHSLTVPDAPVIVAKPVTSSTIQVALAGNAPASGGLPITGYNIWTSSTPQEPVLLASNVALPYLLAATAGAPTYIKAAAVNDFGAGPLSADVSATPNLASPITASAHSLQVTGVPNAGALVEPSSIDEQHKRYPRHHRGVELQFLRARLGRYHEFCVHLCGPCYRHCGRRKQRVVPRLGWRRTSILLSGSFSSPGAGIGRVR